MAGESQEEPQDETLVESSSRYDAAPRVDAIMLGGPVAGYPWSSSPWQPREPAAASASVPVEAGVSIKKEEQEHQEVAPAARAPSHGAVAQEQKQKEVPPTAQAPSHGAVAKEQPTGAALAHAAPPPAGATVLPGAQPVKREARGTGDGGGDQAQSHEPAHKKPRSTDDLFEQPPPKPEASHFGSAGFENQPWQTAREAGGAGSGDI